MKKKATRTSKQVPKGQAKGQRKGLIGAALKKPKRKATTTAEAGPSAVDRLLATHGTVTDSLRVYRFAGVALGGGKTDKTAVAILEFFPDQKRVFLRSVRDKISVKGDYSADEALYEMLTEEERNLNVIALDAPLQLPKCFRCDIKCPGVAKCPWPEVKWMRDVHNKRAKSKRPNKMFTPYTERAAEIFLSHELEEAFHPPHAMGSNAAPLTARVRFFERRMLGIPFIEVYPKTTLWRIGMDLGLPKSYLRFHRHAVDSDEARLYILKTLIEKEIAFIYQQDLRLMVENSIAFDAFLCALTAFLKHRGQTELPPANFPKDASWIDFPKQKIQWF